MNKPVKPLWSGQNIVDNTEWGIRDFQLFDLLKNGLKALASKGKIVVDSDSLPKGRRCSLKSYEKLAQLAIGTEKTGKVITGRHVGGYNRPARSADEIMQDFRRQYYSQPEDILIVPKSCEAISFNLPDDDKARDEAIKKALSFLFKYVDVVKYVNEYNQSHPLPAEETHNLPEQDFKDEAKEIKDPDGFVRDLQVSYLDNTEVKIQYKGKRVNCNCELMGFRDSNTKEWKTFLEILQNDDHVYSLGPAYSINKKLQRKVRIKTYDNKLKLLKEINKKLIIFLTDKYKVTFPNKFKLYELQPAKGPGVYSFKFQPPSDNPSYNTKDQTLKRLEMLIQNGAADEAIQQAALKALEAGATEYEVWKIVQDRLPSQPEYHGKTDDHKNDDYEDEKEAYED